MHTGVAAARFEEYIRKEKLFSPDHKILLAVSGGMDSMLMSWLFQHAGFRFAIAHCNFKLRGQESDLDEALVKNTAEKYGVAFFQHSFDVKKLSREQGISTQMAARELRYLWFDQLCQTHSFDRIALAQHADDLAETVLLNLVRGTGISGLHGILSLNDKKIRPLLFLKKTEIRNLVFELKIDYREDRSNASVDYTRNKLRLEVIPLLQEINPSLQETFGQNARRMASVERLYQERIEELRETLTSLNPATGSLLIEIKSLRALGNDAPFVLFELLRPGAFSEAVAVQIVEGLGKQAGKIYHSSSHVLIRDRKHLILEKKQETEENPVFEQIFKIDYPETAVQVAGKEQTACFDAALLAFPLRVRFWKEGDFFYPLGMTRKKKLSDFFTDQKIPLTEKHRILLVTSGDRIIWIVGYRIDEHFKISAETRKIIRLTLQMPNADT